MQKKIPRINITNYHGQWVALHPQTDKVIGHGQTLKSAEKGAKKRGISHPAFFRVPKSKGIWIGGHLHQA